MAPSVRASRYPLSLSHSAGSGGTLASGEPWPASRLRRLMVRQAHHERTFLPRLRPPNLRLPAGRLRRTVDGTNCTRRRTAPPAEPRDAYASLLGHHRFALTGTPRTPGQGRKLHRRERRDRPQRSFLVHDGLRTALRCGAGILSRRWRQIADRASPRWAMAPYICREINRARDPQNRGTMTYGKPFHFHDSTA